MIKGNTIGWRVGSTVFKLGLVLGLLATSCTSATSTPTPPLTVDLTDTPSPTFTPEPTPETKIPAAEIDALMYKLVEQTPLAGIALGVQYKGIVYEQGYGLADIASREPVTKQTVFKIASLTKAVTAAAILKLEAEGQLSLNDSISKFFPGVPESAKTIQVRHLLNHTSGLPDVSIDEAQAALPETFTTAQAVEYYFKTIEPLGSEPGQIWSYNNAGYFLLGAIIENITGMPYDQYFKTKFFELLELTSVSECPPQSELLAVGHHALNGGFEVANPSNLRLAGAAGALCSNIGDLLRWQVALTHDRPELWNQMITPETLPDGRLLDYGYGVSVQNGDQGPMMMHDGATAGFNSFFIYYPEQDLNIVLLTNTDGFDSHLRAFATLVASKILSPS
jgi:CubicO group peptidase (beta-lactamase class C family)